jgi:hypothetical protein
MCGNDAKSAATRIGGGVDARLDEVAEARPMAHRSGARAGARIAAQGFSRN